MPACWVDIKVDKSPENSTMEGYLTLPEAKGRHPAIVVIQEIWGVNSHIQSVLDRLPSQGYVGLAPAMFHREGPMTTGLHEEMDTAIARMRRSIDADILSDVRAAVDYINAQSFVKGDKIGIVGFCGGGIGMALGDGPSPLEQTANIGCPVLGLFGDEDANPTPEDVAKIDPAMTKHEKTHEFHSYAGAGHGFHCEARASYRPEATADAWSKAMAWFDKHLK